MPGGGPLPSGPFQLQLQLQLQQETRHGPLWAYDADPLDLVRRFVRAPLRERAPWYATGQQMPQVARLPGPGQADPRP
ncbi:hypothetical protein SDIAM26S_03926 [Streptomyces diastaticus subsp. diastaticus]